MTAPPVRVLDQHSSEPTSGGHLRLPRLRGLTCKRVSGVAGMFLTVCWRLLYDLPQPSRFPLLGTGAETAAREASVPWRRPMRGLGLVALAVSILGVAVCPAAAQNKAPRPLPGNLVAAWK